MRISTAIAISSTVDSMQKSAQIEDMKQQEINESNDRACAMSYQLCLDPAFAEGVNEGIARAQEILLETVENDHLDGHKSNFVSRFIKGEEKCRQEEQACEKEFQDLLHKALDEEVFTPLANGEDDLLEIAQSAARINEDTPIMDAKKLGYFGIMEHCARRLACGETAKIVGHHIFGEDTIKEEAGAACRQAANHLSRSVKHGANLYMEEVNKKAQAEIKQKGLCDQGFKVSAKAKAATMSMGA